MQLKKNRFVRRMNGVKRSKARKLVIVYTPEHE